MTLRKPIALCAVVVTLILLACAGAIEPNAGDAGCSAGERVYNGACYPSCTRSEQCSSVARCLSIDTSAAICASPRGGDCTYLGSDTICAGVGVYFASSGGRGSTTVRFTSDPPNADPSAATGLSDPAFESDASSLYNPSDGCKGNAKWTTTPVTSNPGCGQKHAVRRCRLYGSYQCRLVDGTTTDRPNL